ncbi:hypothetical protein OAU52_01080 [bacterium]|nr:hypothetical protein [bacterium]
MNSSFTKAVAVISLLLISCVGKIIDESEVICTESNKCQEISSETLKLSSFNTLFDNNFSSESQISISSQGIISSSTILEESNVVILSSTMTSSSSYRLRVSSSIINYHTEWEGGEPYKKIIVDDMDHWGLVGEDKGAYVFPWTDVFHSGSSQVLDENGNPLGHCPEGNLNCQENWNLTTAFVSVDYVKLHLTSKLKVLDYVPASQGNWGWGTAGWWIIPAYDRKMKGATPFDRAAPMGLKSTDWINLEMSFEKGATLTIELKGEGIDENDSNQSPPRFSYDGTGYFESISFPVRAIKRAGWSQPVSYDVTKVSAIGLMRLEASLEEGASFPENVTNSIEFSFRCFSIGESQWDNHCYSSCGFGGERPCSPIDTSRGL